MDSPSSSTRPLPPWLWFWLILYLLTIPTQLALIQPRLADLFSATPLPGETLIPWLWILRLLNLVELFPVIVVFGGVLLIFLPAVRGRLVEGWFSLKKPPEGAIPEIRTFIAQKAPGLEVRVNLLRSDMPALIYPLGYDRFAIGVFGSLLKLWRSDPEAARTILMHEIGHYRQGDALVQGVGVFFGEYLRRWPLILGILAIAPIFLVWMMENLQALFGMLASAGPLGLVVGLAGVLFRFYTILVPGITWILLGLLLWTASVLVLPLAGVWMAELSADRFALESRASAAGLQRALDRFQPRKRSWRWFVWRMSHPPVSLRRWLAQRSTSAISLVVLLVIFPLAVLVRGLLLAAWAMTGYLTTGAEAFVILRAVGENFLIFLSLSFPIWLVMAVVIVVWPLAARPVEQALVGAEKRPGWNRARGILAGSLLVAVLACSSLYLSVNLILPGLSLPNTGSAPPDGQLNLNPGDLVEVEWEGRWFPAEIIEVGDEEYLIHYEGYENFWDEWVEPDRIRSRR
jgi:hypothetical protein